ncbi:radial spoke head 14 homolog [Lampris incognitus]|uniref:radial spoke head 14 homolog n=1 Tax=Lampris incognitus TaxID=2546036 RepID=UPI0024B5D04C|nr:radial spoke head 14 homolog [Lampris incognitus]
MSGGHTEPSPWAFGQRALPRLSDELRCAEPGSRPRALAALCDLVHDPERAYETIKNGCLEQLKDLLKDEDLSIRAKAAEVLHILAAHSVGREALLLWDVLSPLSELLGESDVSCRRNIHGTLNRLAHLPSGAEAMLTLGLVPRMLMKVGEEEEEDVKALLLSSISLCVRLDARPALASDGVSVLGQELSHASSHIRTAAAAALLAISILQEGKQRVCKEGLLPVLVRLLTDSDPGAQANAAGIIMNTAVATQGKLQALDAEVLPPLLDLVSSRHRAVCLNALQALTVLAEAPAARQLLLDHLQLLRSRTGADEEKIVRRAANTAVRVVTWMP